MTNHRKNGDFRKGNTARQKGDQPADGNLHVRAPMTTKGRWVAASRAAGLTLSEWVTRTLDAAAGGRLRDIRRRPAARHYVMAQMDERGAPVYSLVLENQAGTRWVLLRSGNADDMRNLALNPEALRMRLENPTEEDLKLRVRNPENGWPAA